MKYILTRLCQMTWRQSVHPKNLLRGHAQWEAAIPQICSMISVIFGTRPEAIKLGPIVAELRASGVSVSVLLTGQHRELLAGTPAESDLADAESLGLASDGRVLAWLRSAQRALLPRLAEAPSVVVVQGDTMSALAGARAA